jgi:hypothetical protein
MEGRMNLSEIRGYLCNCFWLLVPILAFNLLFTHLLPAAYQVNIFWKDIPKSISIPENLLRTLVMILPVFMKLGFSTRSQKIGLVLYMAGMLIYFASWTVLILSPSCAWSTSMFGFLAPAYTPIVWLIGIGLIGDDLLLTRISWKPWIYWAVSVCFLLFHNRHAFTIYSRGI